MAKKKPAKGATPRKNVAKRPKGVIPPKESKAKAAKGASKRDIEQYDHAGVKRPNNPPVGLVTPETDPPAPPRKTYEYDPHLDPQLVWAGKAEHTSFEVPTVSLHVHERIDPRTIIAAVRTNGDAAATPASPSKRQQGLFEDPDENPPRREAVEFYKHAHGWSNRLVAGDSLLVMNSLLEKEGMAGKVQMIYIDPPYGIRYGSNFQPFVHQRDVKDGNDADLTQEPEMIRAFRDTWQLGIHSFLTYLRDRLNVARDLLNESGSVFVQIGDANVHIIRVIMDEIFGSENFCSLISYATTTTTTGRLLPGTNDFVLWYAKNIERVKYRALYTDKTVGGEGASNYTSIELPDGDRRKMTVAERKSPTLLPKGSRPYRFDNLTSPRVREGRTGFYSIPFGGREYEPRAGEWKTHREGMDRLRIANRLGATATGLYYIRFIDDFPAFPINNGWSDTVVAGFATNKVYVVQTNPKVIARCLLMTTDPGDLVLDPTCGSGTTATVAEQWGRRWITCDTSRVAVTLAKQRLLTAAFDYYELARPNEGVRSGFVYKTVPHVTLKSIANNPEIHEGMTRAEIDAAIARYADQETLYDQPKVDKQKVRVTGPFTVEAVPAVMVEPLDSTAALGSTGGSNPENALPADASVARTGPSVRQEDWRDELLKTGVRAKGGAHLEFARLEPLGAMRYLHATGETRGDDPKRIVVSFGPEHAPLEQRQVSLALDEAERLRPKPALIVFAAFHIDPEAQKDIDETHWPGVEVLKVQMNADLLTDDLKKKKSSNESFWLIGQPDVEVSKVRPESRGSAPQYSVTIHGFDYYNPSKGTVQSGGTQNIALWLLDTDYDGRSLYPRQVFFVLSPGKDQLQRLAKTLKAEIDPDLIESYYGTESLPFEAGEHRRAAVKIVDDRGIESLKIIHLD
ncbi:site-specific DNA-methyltransferase [Lacipirellula limnantheis]|uniref:Putative methyltransferase n=1 Tax=Lacipirellula limnantheis TaxID=2528024 RepID=A0A517TRG4_9BACT|nr:site-specific DNA-methyltransferase [Lacipirellula limnantheis]QDT70965.1 putative methyltransferase [Lacipirellula limnantheis]